MLQKPVANPVYFSEPNHIQLFDKENFIQLVENSGLRGECKSNCVNGFNLG
jgi:hypothetical protein